MLTLDTELLDNLSEQAKQSPRLRMNYNLHDSLEAKAQRLFNALEPGTEMPIHRHHHTAETYLLVRGKLRVMFYDDAKNEIASTTLDLVGGKYGVQIPVHQWHSLEVMESGTVIFEVKDGPYTPLADADILK